MSTKPRRSTYVQKPGVKNSPGDFNTAENTARAQKFNESGNSSRKKYQTGAYHSPNSQFSPGNGNAFNSSSSRMRHYGQGNTDSYDKELEEFPNNASSGVYRTHDHNTSFATKLRSIHTKSSKFGDEKNEQVDDLFMKNGFYQSKGEFSMKNSAQQDCYFKNMNEFVDDKLDMVVEKLAEKKALKTANNTLRCVLDKLDSETQTLLKEKDHLEHKYDKEFTVNRKLNSECDDLLDQLTMIRENLENYRIAENANINAMREDEAELREQHQDNKQQFNLDKNMWNDTLKGQREDIADLEEENKLAQINLKDSHAKYKYCVKLEHEKSMVFKEKNKILEQLVNDERPILKANTNKRVFDITKTFCKKLDQRKISQAVDTTRGVIDLSNTRLFNTTMNSMKQHATFERSYDTSKFQGTKKKGSRSSLHNVSHHASQY